MADTKISALTELTAGNQATGDLLVVVDVSDTSMAGSGTDKKIQVGSLNCSGAEINTGTDPVKFATPKAIADSNLRVIAQAEAWTSWTPTPTSGSGSFTSVSAQGYWTQIGKTVVFSLIISITTNGTAATSVIFALPATARRVGGVFAGRENASTGKSLNVEILSTTTARIENYDNTYPGGNGYSLNINGTYEAA